VGFDDEHPITNKNMLRSINFNLFIL